MFVSRPEGDNGLLVITVSGRLDSTVKEELQDYLKPHRETLTGSKVLVDLSGVLHVDTKGVGQLILCHKFFEEINCMVCWIVLPKQEQVKSVLSRTGLDKILKICDDLNDGFKKLLGRERQ
jgi:anti-anti-sigma factor